MLDSPEEFKNLAAGIPHAPHPPKDSDLEWGLGMEVIISPPGDSLVQQCWEPLS